MVVPSDKTTFTLGEAAKLLSCHRETLRRAIRDGKLRAAKLGRGFRISRFDLETFWTESGGGDLFGKHSGETPPQRETNIRTNAGQPPVRKKKKQQMQFSLPGTGATDAEDI